MMNDYTLPEHHHELSKHVRLTFKNQLKPSEVFRKMVVVQMKERKEAVSDVPKGNTSTLSTCILEAGTDEGTVPNHFIVCGGVGYGKTALLKRFARPILHSTATDKELVHFIPVSNLQTKDNLCRIFNSIFDRSIFDGLDQTSLNEARWPEVTHPFIRNIRNMDTKIYRAEVTPTGIEVNVGGCVINFPEGAVSKKTPFYFKTTTHQSEAMENYQVVSPTLICSPSMEFSKMVRIELPTWCISCPEIDVICNREDGSATYVHSVTENHEGDTLVFGTGHFTRFTGAIKSSKAKKSSYIIRWLLYRMGQKYHASFHLTSADDLLEEAGKLESKGFKMVQIANALLVKFGDTVEINFSSDEGYKVQPGKFTLQINDGFLRAKYAKAEFLLQSAPKGSIQEIQCEVRVNSRDVDVYPINHIASEEDEPPCKTRRTKRAPASSSSKKMYLRSSGKVADNRAGCASSL